MWTTVRCGTGTACGTVDRVIHVNVSRLRRTLLAATIAASVAVPLSEAARPSAVPAPVPTASASPLSEAARPLTVPTTPDTPLSGATHPSTAPATPATPLSETARPSSVPAASASPLSETARPSTVPTTPGAALGETARSSSVPAVSASPLSRAARPSVVSGSVPAASASPLSETARPSAVPAVSASPRTAAAAALAARYAAVRGDIVAAERMAAGYGHRRRAALLRAMADPARRFLSFDGRDGGRAAEVFGDLAAAGHLAVLVPGGDTHLDKYGLLRGSAVRLSQTLGGRSAVVAWLGYRTPNTVSLASLTTGRADEAVPPLRAFIREVSELNPAARITLVCHSYGSVVCARAAPGLDVAGIVLIGSPSVTAGDVAALRTPATVWAGRGSRDWIAGVPHTRLRLPYVTIGFGADPVAPNFGARVFAAGDGGHSDYFKAGSPSLTNIARIVSGQPPAEARGGH
ncbi:alpha/beta hydrolase [Nonomuraea fuscirosea]|nr:alpha/beta hydrolase [Nonomuraea fuscirosea]